MLKKILHVDDDDDIRAVTRLALELVGGFTVFQCASGQEAIEQAESFAPDLILLDVMMPGLDGVQTFHRLKEVEALASLPIVFATAKVHAESVQQLHAIGAAGVIAKPFDPIELSNKLNLIWEQSRFEIS
ncbi:response regulator [Phaeovulum sp.]|uniref:response regulator n=1 Tax=Phaeovulum sp. TaxID=2934796 RepID=UPI0039E37052